MSLNLTEPEVEVERPGSSPINILMTPQGEDAGLDEFTRGLLPDDVDTLIRLLQKVKSERQGASSSGLGVHEVGTL